MIALGSIIYAIEYRLKNSGFLRRDMVEEKIKDFVPTIGANKFELRDLDDVTSEITVYFDDVKLIGKLTWRKGEVYPYVLTKSELIEVVKN